MAKTAVPVIIVAAGPVGLALGLGLARRGVESIILEGNDVKARSDNYK